MRFPDPMNDFDSYDLAQTDKLSKLPLCECCGNPIQQEKAVYYNDQWVCEACEYQFWLDIRSDFLAQI